MAWKTSAPELVERFNAALPKHTEAQARKMFGYPCCFVNGNFFVGMHEDNMVVRLTGDLKSRFAELKTAKGFDPMGNGKGMKHWWIIAATILRGLTTPIFLLTDFVVVDAMGDREYLSTKNSRPGT